MLVDMEREGHRFELRANCSLSAGEAVGVFVFIATASLVIAFMFVFQGYWPVLPFAGLELAFLGWALRASWRNGQAREELEIDADEIVIRRYRGGDSHPTTTRLPRTWTRAAIIRGSGPRGGEQLALGQRGRWWVIGGFLADEERRSLHARLDQVLRQRGHS